MHVGDGLQIPAAGPWANCLASSDSWFPWPQDGGSNRSPVRENKQAWGSRALPRGGVVLEGTFWASAVTPSFQLAPHPAAEGPPLWRRARETAGVPLIGLVRFHVPGPIIRPVGDSSVRPVQPLGQRLNPPEQSLVQRCRNSLLVPISSHA